MSDLIKQYGIVVVYAIVGILTIGILYGVFTKQWKVVGAVPNGTKMSYQNKEIIPKNPILVVEDQIIMVGENINARSFAHAKETTGKNISDKIQIVEIEGELLMPDFSIDTTTTGTCLLEYSVKGENGIVVNDRIRVIIDQR